MSNYLTEGWPLTPTSTVYMDGTAVFDVREHGEAGIRASVTMTPAQAQIIRDVVSNHVRDEKDDAYHEGFNDGTEWAAANDGD